jgi:hypothetical protein
MVEEDLAATVSSHDTAVSCFGTLDPRDASEQFRLLSAVDGRLLAPALVFEEDTGSDSSDFAEAGDFAGDTGSAGGTGLGSGLDMLEL